MEQLKTKKVLLLDDDASIRKALEYYMRGKIQRFETAGTAERGRILLDEDKWDIIICDYELPGMNGIDFFKIVHQERPDVVRIMITAYGGLELRTQVSLEGINEMIPKPFDGAALVKAMAFHIQKHGEQDS
jgi:DNA-binding NtrC family response regulator